MKSNKSLPKLQSQLEIPVSEKTEKEEEPRLGELVEKWTEPNVIDSSVKFDFDVNKAWNVLFNLASCYQIILNENVQKQMKLQVGVHVTQEFPWKQIMYKYFYDMFDSIDNGPTLKGIFQGCDPNAYILIGYAPLLTQNVENPPEGDPFIFFISSEDAKFALAVIRNIESFERWAIDKRIEKNPRPWSSLGSENEIQLGMERSFMKPVDVEVQSIYPPSIPAEKQFSFRKSADVRDGYVELVPTEGTKFENISRKRLTVSVQSSPPMVECAQQTNPTFPINAWSQYLYEIKEGEDGLSDTSEEEETDAATHPKLRPSRPATPESETVPPKPPPEISEAIKFLLETLEFNQVDMYRNDYPLISEKEVEHYTIPYLEETLCFANISKSYQRYVCGVDWYPALSGLIVTSYTFSSKATIDSVYEKKDTVQRAVLQPNPILMWNFSDNLDYKLEFESPLEVTTLSFSPYNADILLGGCVNGRLIIWDLQNRVEKLDTDEILTANQAKYRILINDFLKWTIQFNEDAIVPPANITSLEVSQKAAITAIYWLGNRVYINTFGKLHTSSDYNATNVFFITSAMDGTYAFWNLDGTPEKKSQSSARDQPKALTQSESPYKTKVFKPIFTVAYNEPITALIGDTTVFRCLVLEPLKRRKNKLNYRTQLECVDPNEARQFMIISTFYGRIERINWLGVYSDADGKETASSSQSFARVHDGPVLDMQKNPFYPEIFASIGRNVFAVWKEDYNYSPIFWRQRPSGLTTLAWSEVRPGVLFLTRSDGYFEAWDIIARDDDACFNDILGGGIMTAISEHRPNDPDKLLGIGDYNSSFRMVKLPPIFYVPLAKEQELVENYVKKEESRKKSIQAWEHKYFENNRDIIEIKLQAEADTQKEMEQIEKENMLQAARKAKEEAEEKKSAEPVAHLPYTERMRRQWDELNLNRLMTILMSRKRVNAEQLVRETALEKERLAYEAAKKESLVQILQRAGEEVAQVRSRILPAEVADMERTELIYAAVQEVLKLSDPYSNIEIEAQEIIDEIDEYPVLDYVEFKARGIQRRLLLMKSLGGNTERLHWYENMQEIDQLDECNWGYDAFVNAYEALDQEDVPDTSALTEQPYIEEIDDV